MKRAALCFSGQFRNVRKTYDGWMKPNILDANPDYEIDVFIHAWFSKDDFGKVYNTAAGEQYVASVAVPNNILEDIYEMYNPKTLYIEKQISFDPKDYAERKYPSINPAYSLSKMYSTLVANDLKRKFEITNKFVYDVVITTRYDWAFQQPLSFNIVNKCGIWHCSGCPHGPTSINTPFIMGTSKEVDVFSDLFVNVDTIYRKGVPFCDEFLAYELLASNGIPIYEFSNPYQIIRG